MPVLTFLRPTCLVLAQLWCIAPCILSASYFKGRHRHNSAFLSQNSEIVEVHSVGTRMQPGRTEELTLPQGQPSAIEDGNWQLNGLLWRDKLNTYSSVLLNPVTLFHGFSSFPSSFLCSSLYFLESVPHKLVIFTFVCQTLLSVNPKLR